MALACAGSAGPASAQNPLLGSPDVDPPGVNDFGCKPPPKHRYPIVIVHGTFGDRTYTSLPLAPPMQRLGYCVFALDYGMRGTGPIEKSAEQLKAFVDRVLAATGAERVSIVGHSQGGLMPRYYIRFLGGKSKIKDMIGLSPSNHGTDNPIAPPVGELAQCPACEQQSPYKSDFTRRINRDDETLGKIDYTQIQTRFDEVVVPYFSAFLANRPGTSNSARTSRQNGPHTTNFCLQDKFPNNASDHLDIVNDPQAFTVVLDALNRKGPARPPAQPDSVCAQTS